ncbi:GNAT family N-acetyltransferase [Actinomadura algeriensis]|uniref:RimJ/RimL family protein N-acetyltransferase n=1 Tax=Actinomadura algeriensis TaxID=1679523 RepID=A0ABR9JTA2_9ACTN|nr:GNAT family protein [Actinomadura algeriensis]MBE1533624.1 RimJ/RimL family protein N-acetyltransferase [Actinomadura algeriensis]
MEWYEMPVITGRHVRLEPLTEEHAEGLFAASADPATWTWLNEPRPRDVEDMRASVRKALRDRERGLRLPWAQLDPRTGEVAGTTSYYEISPRDRGLCIGYTWLGARWRRSGTNTESKLLLLERAFDELKAVRVGWHTNALNERSRAAIERLGASFEGVHRKHRLRPDGTFRDTAVYGMTDDDWAEAGPALRARLR